MNSHRCGPVGCVLISVNHPGEAATLKSEVERVLVESGWYDLVNVALADGSCVRASGGETDAIVFLPGEYQSNPAQRVESRGGMDFLRLRRELLRWLVDVVPVMA